MIRSQRHQPPAAPAAAAAAAAAAAQPVERWPATLVNGRTILSNTKTVVAGKLSSWLRPEIGVGYQKSLIAAIQSAAAVAGTYQFAAFLLLLLYSSWLMSQPTATINLHLAAVEFDDEEGSGVIFTQKLCRWAIQVFCEPAKTLASPDRDNNVVYEQLRSLAEPLENGTTRSPPTTRPPRPGL